MHMDERQVVFCKYENNEILKIDTLRLDITNSNGISYYTYKLNNDTLIYSFYKPTNNDSSIFLGGISCPLVSEKTITLSDKKFRILKYYFDIGNSVDEESSFFYNTNYGLLIGFNNGWSDLIFSMEYDSVSKALMDSILNDNTGFYSIVEPPPPPPDSLMYDVYKNE